MSAQTTNHEIIEQKCTILIQQFAAGCAVIAKMMMENAENSITDIKSREDYNINNLKQYELLHTASEKLLVSLNDPEYNYSKRMRKIYDTIKTESACRYLIEYDSSLFRTKNEKGKIICYFKGMNIDLVYRHLDEESRKVFWDYFYVVIQSVLLVFKLNNPKSINAKVHVLNAMEHIENSLSDTGVRFNDVIFNPFLGIGEDNQKYDVTTMYSNLDALPTQNVGDMSVLLKTLNLDKMIDLKAYKEKLDNFTEEDIKVTELKIRELLDIPEDSAAGVACGSLLSNLVTQLQADGLDNIGATLQKTAELSKGDLSVDAIKEAGSYAQQFINNGMSKFDAIAKDNPDIDPTLLNSLMGTMHILKNVSNMTGSSNANAEINDEDID
jgi:hypothetical protein